MADFHRVGVFTYSDEEGSAAFELDDKVDSEVMKERERQLMKEQARISKRRNRGIIGEHVKVLLEGTSRDTDLLLEGRMESQAPEIDGSVLINDAPEA